MFILNEREYAEECLRNNTIGEKPFTTLLILAKYYYHIKGYRKVKITSLLTDFLFNNYDKYDENKPGWQKSIEKIAANAGAYQLYEIQGVRITKSEMNIIKSLHSKYLERILFVMLCIAKFNNIKNEKNNNWINVDSKEVFKCARISSSVMEQDIKINKLWQTGLIEFSKRNDNLNLRLVFVNDDDDEELFISDFRELGYEYLKYNGENFKKCSECGILIRDNKYGNKKYCSKCSKYEPIINKTIICIDCGEEFSVASKNNKTNRCPNCRKNHIKKYDRDRKRK